MKGLAAAFLFAVGTYAGPVSVDAQQLAPRLSSEWSRTVAEQEKDIPTSTLIAGSALGWMVGLAAGGAIGYMIEPDAGESWVGASEWWIGGYLGSSLGAALGAHLANNRRGNLFHSSIGALLVGPALYLVTLPIGGAAAALSPVAQIAISVRIERRRGSPTR